MNIKDKISHVLQSGLSNYMIAKRTNQSSANYVAYLRKGESEIENMTLKTAFKFESLYDEMKKEEE